MPWTDGELRITSKGFQFLLQDQLNMQLVEVLNFFFQLGSLELGQDYSIETLTPTQKHMLDDLKHLGLIYQRKKKSTRFYPTRLATSLTSGSSMSVSLTSRDQAAESEGFIIVETNYRVYAYTNSPLQIAVLSLFVSMRVRFANMVIGLITRDSVRDALAKGITSDQSPVIPSTIVDQIRLWEMERNRLRISRGYLYQMFSREQDYRDILKQATDFGYELWHSDAKRLIVVSNEGHEHIKAFVARQRQQQQQQQQQRSKEAHDAHAGTRLVQTTLQLGQRRPSARTCSECGMEFVAGEDEDQRLHRAYHRTFLNGVRWVTAESQVMLTPLTVQRNVELPQLFMAADRSYIVHVTLLSSPREWTKGFVCLGVNGNVKGCTIAEPISIAYEAVSTTECSE
nr:RNA polymerase II transcription factor B 52 kDa subunit [Polyrhizophydium stewartii]